MATDIWNSTASGVWNPQTYPSYGDIVNLTRSRYPNASVAGMAPLAPASNTANKSSFDIGLGGGGIAGLNGSFGTANYNPAATNLYSKFLSQTNLDSTQPDLQKLMASLRTAATTGAADTASQNKAISGVYSGDLFNKLQGLTDTAAKSMASVNQSLQGQLAANKSSLSDSLQKALDNFQTQASSNIAQTASGLKNIRTQENTAGTQQVALNNAQNTAALLSQLGRTGGGASSYIASGMTGPSTQALINLAANEANQARQDFTNTQGQSLGLVGAVNAQNQGNIGQLSALDLANIQQNASRSDALNNLIYQGGQSNLTNVQNLQDALLGRTQANTANAAQAYGAPISAYDNYLNSGYGTINAATQANPLSYFTNYAPELVRAQGQGYTGAPATPQSRYPTLPQIQQPTGYSQPTYGYPQPGAPTQPVQPQPVQPQPANPYQNVDPNDPYYYPQAAPQLPTTGADYVQRLVNSGLDPTQYGYPQYGQSPSAGYDPSTLGY